ncbi:MAG: Gfo/Idh/MocA family oxidoreductase [Candidatus Poribacteria bacterium]
MDILRMGFIGCGGQASANIYPHITAIREMELVACCDLIEEKAKQNAERFGAKAWYTDYEKMLDNEGVDAVFIVGQPKMHTELGIACLEKGYHIFTEKPTATNLADAKKMAETAERVGKQTQVGHMLRHGPATKVAKKVIASEDFGNPIFVESKYFVPGPREPMPSWDADTLDWAYMLVQAVHPVDWARHIMGDIVSLSTKRGLGKNGAVSYVVAVEFANGMSGLINMTSAAPFVVAELEAVGDNGTFLHIDNMIRIRYQGGNWKEPQVIDYGRREAGYFDEVKDFGVCVLEGKPTYPTFRDEYKALLICQAIVDSIESGNTVSVPQE